MSSNLDAKKRVFLIILDSFGIGEAPDAEDFGDRGANTLKSISETGKLNIDNLISLGLGNIDGVNCVPRKEHHKAVIARMREASMGKDTTIGHWEIAGHISDTPLPTFPDGFPKEIIELFEKETGRGVLCNKPYSGTKVIADFGEDHMKSGDLIVYTSADSVFQIAAHEDIVPLNELYDICLKARKLLSGTKFGVGRVIARPFSGSAPNFYRTDNRRDFSLPPPKGVLPSILKESGIETIAVGKIHDVFNGEGFDRFVPTHSNREGMKAVSDIQKQDFCGLCFVNLVDFDMLWGHRRDSVGYAEGLNEFDNWLGDFLRNMRDDDLLIISADHGCDPNFLKSSDHTREYTPCIIYSPRIVPANIGTRESFADIGATVANHFEIYFPSKGEPIDIYFN